MLTDAEVKEIEERMNDTWPPLKSFIRALLADREELVKRVRELEEAIGYVIDGYGDVYRGYYEQKTGSCESLQEVMNTYLWHGLKALGRENETEEPPKPYLKTRIAELEAEVERLKVAWRMLLDALVCEAFEVGKRNTLLSRSLEALRAVCNNCKKYSLFGLPDRKLTCVDCLPGNTIAEIEKFLEVSGEC